MYREKTNVIYYTNLVCDEMNKCYEIEEEYDIDSIKIDEIKEYKMTLPEFNSISFMIED